MSNATSQPLVIGLTGSIGAGKSTVARMLEELGCIVSDSDQLARAAFEDPEVKSEILRWWGSRIEGPSEAIDRSKVASIVFAPPDASLAERISSERERARLEALIHPWIHARRAAQFAAVPSGVAGVGAGDPRLNAKVCVIDAPLLLESNLLGECSTILFVDAPLSVRLARVAASRGWSADDLARRESAQMPLDQKRKFADHVVINDGSLQSLRAHIARLLSHILAQAR